MAEPEPAAEGASSDAPAERYGVLGGTFDPPHIGHLWLAALARDALGLGRVLFMPASRPPHKNAVASATDRLLMTRLAIDGEPGFELSTIEVERPGVSYTVDSAEELRNLYPGAALYLVMSVDALAGIDAWREPERLLSLMEWAVGPRPGGVPEPDWLSARFGDAAARIHLLDGPALDVSSSDIRARVAAGQTIRYLVPRAVEELIEQRGMYRDRR